MKTARGRRAAEGVSGVVLTRNAWQSLAYSPLGAVVNTNETHLLTDRRIS